MSPRAIIFDFDGVIVDSEKLANELLAAELTAVGLPTSYQDSLRLYMGRHWADNAAAIEARLGRPLPPDLRERISGSFHARIDEVGAVPGVQAFLDRTAHLPRAVASSSPVAWLRGSLERLGLAHHFGDRLFSAAEHVSRGKPAPDIYLHAAGALGVPPAEILVIEDTPTGAAAGLAAGMMVVGLCAGGHCGPDHGESLRAAGVERVARSWAEVEETVGV